MTDAKKELKRRRAQKINRMKKNSIGGKIQKRKEKDLQDTQLEARSSNPDSYKKSVGRGKTSPASKGPGPLLRFCNGKSKPYSRKK